ncbi:MAG: hypothetical protein FD127_945 [Acidimicrobiaceae bacterium]|jgi:hypothetical protein|nr:MAG: hypothetical protein FD127_945 [Acidimicrobiaceae bacterium]
MAGRVCRGDDVLWRLGPGQVVVRRVGYPGLDLAGLAAMVWLALDEPSTASEIADVVAGLEGTDVAAIVAAVEELIAVGVVRHR